MCLHQCFYCPVTWQDTAIADIHGLIFDADLDGDAGCIVVVGQRIVNRLAYALVRERVGLYPHVVLIGNGRFEVLRIDQINDLIVNVEQRTFLVFVPELILLYRFYCQRQSKRSKTHNRKRRE